MKKKVIAYLHTHWDREWYREFEVFRMRLVRVFDRVLDMLESGKIPAFYFDGQVAALLDYLEIRPEKESLIRRLIQEKKLFIGPFYTLVDEFLTDRICFEKNLEIGMKIARDFGCEGFIGYLADTFGHSQNVPKILAKYGVDKCVVWRGCPDEIQAEFKFNGVDTVNLVRGYFMDCLEPEFLKNNLDLIAEKSGDVLLLPIGADHRGIDEDIVEKIAAANAQLEDYEIQLGSIFDYFEAVRGRFAQKEWNDELRDNSKTFILNGSYSARTKIKQWNVEAANKLHFADKLSAGKYASQVEYAYKLLLQNQAHDGICGCSTDDVHEENIIRYKKVLQIANTIIEELRLTRSGLVSFTDYKGVIEYESTDVESQVVAERRGFETKLLHDTQRIPVTEDYTTIYTNLREIVPSSDVLQILDTEIGNSHLVMKIEQGEFNLYIDGQKWENFIEFTRVRDMGDTYNHGLVEGDRPERAFIISYDILFEGDLRVGLKVKTTFFDILITLNKNSRLLNFKIEWDNRFKNTLWQAKFNLPQPVVETFSEDMNEIIRREFDPNWNPRQHLPKERGHEVKTNFAPMQRFVWAQGLGVITKGLTEYEVEENSLKVTLLRSVGVISNPANPCRTTPAGPPIEVPAAQQIGRNSAEFSVGVFALGEAQTFIDEIYSQTVIL
ncbi:MAG: hypothetical protein NC390_03950 [Fusobacterium sp.]|nr:hypothetical protein [Fusobacterium sp.]